MNYGFNTTDVDQMIDEIEETWTVRDLLDALHRHTRLRYNLDVIIHDCAAHIIRTRRHDREEYFAECQAH